MTVFDNCNEKSTISVLKKGNMFRCLLPTLAAIAIKCFTLTTLVLCHWRHTMSLETQNSTSQVYTVSFIVFGKLHCFGTVDICVISRPKWLKFSVQAHLFKMIGHTKFQLSISCTFKVMKLLVEITKKSNSNFLHKWAYNSSSVDFSAKVHS